MFKTILVPLDGTPEAEAAIPYAATEARLHRATLTLLQVIPRPEPCPASIRRGGPRPWRPTWDDERMRGLMRKGYAYLGGVIARYRLPAETATRVAVGDPMTQIAATARRLPGCLLVMTTSGQADRPRMATSNVYRRLSTAGVAPLLAVRPEAPVTATAGIRRQPEPVREFGQPVLAHAR